MRLAILGASGHGKVIADAALLSGWSHISFFDDAWPALQSNGVWQVEGNTENLIENLSNYNGVIVGIGSNKIRAEKQSLLHQHNANIVTIIHPKASVSSFAKVSEGCVVFAQAVINAFAEVKSGCIINSGAVVEHDSLVGNYCHISPNAVLAGGVKLGQQVWVGASSSVRQCLSIGDFAVIGMSSVVTKNIPSQATVVGNPAKPLISGF